MVSFSIKLAEVNILVHCLYPSTKEFCTDYLTQESPDFAVEIKPEDISLEQALSDQTSLREGQAPTTYPKAYLETLALLRKLADHLLDYDVLLFHGSAVAVDGRAYLFTAPSGTGKSTHTRLWRQMFGPRAVMINDDKPMLRCTPQGITVFGSPWDGKHRLSCNMAAPLHALCLLSRDDHNHVEPVSAPEAFPVLLQQSYRPAGCTKMDKLLELLDYLSQAPLYRLGCNMSPEAANVAYLGIQGTHKPDF